MATPPQTLPPSGPPPPQPRSGSNAVGIALLVVGLIILLSGLAVWGGLQFLAHGVKVHVNNEGGNSKEVSIKTPFGGLDVHKNAGVSEASLGLPIYPDARQAKDEDSASISLGFPGASGLRIVAGKFDSPDSLEKVRAFYQDRLTGQDGAFQPRDLISSDKVDSGLDSGEMGNFVGPDDHGKTVFKIKRKGDERVVALKSQWDGTRIELVRVSKNGAEAN
ncbi:MAG TPA: hypothetical protein VL523_19500 [Terriglobia bacterium]|nr:hypothetical protein [Terriglobia bacterium]